MIIRAGALGGVRRRLARLGGLLGVSGVGLALGLAIGRFRGVAFAFLLGVFGRERRIHLGGALRLFVVPIVALALVGILRRVLAFLVGLRLVRRFAARHIEMRKQLAHDLGEKLLVFHRPGQSVEIGAGALFDRVAPQLDDFLRVLRRH